MKLFRNIFATILLLFVVSCNNEDPLEKYYPNKEAGEVFLETNKLRPEVLTTDSGLQYEKLVEGSGENAIETDVVTIHFQGTKIDETVIQSSLGGDSVDLYTDSYILGWSEALQLMSKGAKYKFYIPYYLAFGTSESKELPPYSVVIYEIELLDINKTKQEGIDFLEINKLRTEVLTTNSGLQYEIITEGVGDSPKWDDTVEVNYHGTLLNENVFDSSVLRGQTSSFNLQQVIPGFSEGIQLMNKGAKYKIFIPYELAYGSSRKQGIPPFSMLVFEIELINF